MHCFLTAQERREAGIHCQIAEIRLYMQEAMEMVRRFSHKTYGAYERYAQDAAEAWLSAIDGGLVRQVRA